MSQSRDRLFPPHLAYGSTGPAVVLLQVLLRSFGYATDDLQMDGFYGDKTREAVKGLQLAGGFAEDEAHGSFDHTTREVAATLWNDLNVNELRHQPFQGRTVWTDPEGQQRGGWPPKK